MDGIGSTSAVDWDTPQVANYNYCGPEFRDRRLDPWNKNLPKMESHCICGRQAIIYMSDGPSLCGDGLTEEHETKYPTPEGKIWHMSHL